MLVEYDIPIGAEKWVILNYNGKLIERYSVSDYGRVYDHKRNCFMPFNHQRGLYWYTQIQVDHSTRVNYAVHRAVLMSFNFISNFSDMQVNHIDGNPQNNVLSNLEWVTPLENTKHSIETGLRDQTGMNNGRTVYTDEEIHKVCKLIDDGYGNAQIATILGHAVEPERSSFCANVSSIRHGKTRRDISTQYNFMKGNVFKSYSEQFTHLVCNFLSDPNRNFTYDQIADYLLISDEERLNFKQYINRLITGREHKTITENYDLKKPVDYYENCDKGYKNRKYA